MAKVRLGFFSFTEITDPTEHRAYNEWHQLDHLPEQYPLDGVVYGQRWVSTPACRRARAVDGPPLGPAHYMTLYLMSEPVDRTLEEFAALGQELRASGRFHLHRKARLSGPLSLATTAAAPRVLVSAAAVPYRPNRGVYVVVHDLSGPEPVPVGSPATRPGDAGDDLSTRLLEARGVAGVWSFVPDARFDRHPWRPGNRSVTVAYLDDEPLDVAPDLGAVVRGASDTGGTGPVVFAGPFETIVPWRWDWFDSESQAPRDDVTP